MANTEPEMATAESGSAKAKSYTIGCRKKAQDKKVRIGEAEALVKGIIKLVNQGWNETFLKPCTHIPNKRRTNIR